MREFIHLLITVILRCSLLCLILPLAAASEIRYQRTDSGFVGYTGSTRQRGRRHVCIVLIRSDEERYEPPVDGKSQPETNEDYGVSHLQRPLTLIRNINLRLPIRAPNRRISPKPQPHIQLPISHFEPYKQARHTNPLRQL